MKQPKMLSVDAFPRAQMHLAAGLRPDPLGQLERSPRPSSRNWGDWVAECHGSTLDYIKTIQRKEMNIYRVQLLQ